MIFIFSLTEFPFLTISSHQVRENDDKRTWLNLPPLIAPTKCSVLPLSNSPEFTPYVEDLSAALRKLGIPNKVSWGGVATFLLISS